MEEYYEASIIGVYQLTMGTEDLYAVLLECKEWEGLVLPIFIGKYEAMAIQMALENYKPIRPLTHDLMIHILDTLGIAIEKVTIDAMVGNYFTATIVLRSEDGKKWHIDARPSDSIALALRTKAPIYIADRLKRHAISEENLSI